MTRKAGTFNAPNPATAPARLLVLAMATLGLIFSLGATDAGAATKQPVDFFGGNGPRGGRFANPQGVAVNQAGAGAANPGDVYVTDTLNHRIERFARDDHGTPADGSDDTYSFLSAWGAGVEPAAGEGYEVCTEAESCREAIASGIGGGLSNPTGIAVDEDTGDVYVADTGNLRVDIYSGDGTFLRAFGFDVVQSGPGDNGTGYEICVPANGDVCKAGVPGSGLGQVGGPIAVSSGLQMGIAVSQPDGNAGSGTVFLADRKNSRVDTYHLDGSSPASIGSSSVFSSESPQSVAVDSRGILYASNEKNNSEVERYDTENADGGGVGFLAPIAAGTNEVQQVTVSATAGTFNLTYAGETTVDLPFNAPADDPHTPGVTDSVAEALTALPSIGGRNLKDGREVRVTGGPGDAGGTSPYRIEFDTGLGARDVEQITVASGATPLSGGSGATATTLTQGQPGLVPGLAATSLATDGDTLYVQRTIGSPHTIQQFGPTNEPGLTVPPSASDAMHGSQFGSYVEPRALAIDQASARIYVVAGDFGEGTGPGVYVLDTPGPGPSAVLESLSNVTPTSATAHATITPNGPPALKYHLEYSTDGTHWESGPEAVLGTQKSPQVLSIALEPGGGFSPETTYHVRLFAKRPFFPAITTPELTFTSPPSPPLVETTGSPVRTTTTARLDSRVDPAGKETAYHFEYGDQGPCESNPCAETEAHAAGSGESFELVSQQIEGLEANTTYHYRVVADNGNPGSPVFGEDMTLTTFASEAPLSHGHFPGPPGSDRAWEMASEPDSGGNPVSGAGSISDNGDRVVYAVNGGTPISEVGRFPTELFAERTPTGWQTKNIYPPREAVRGNLWGVPGGPGDLSSMVVENNFFPDSGEAGVWRLTPSDTPEKLYGYPSSARDNTNFFTVSDDGSRTLISLKGTFDPAHPLPSNVPGLYDVSSGSAKLISLLPDGSTPPCGIQGGQPAALTARLLNWVSPDGSLAFFESTGSTCNRPQRLYLRNIPAETTKLISDAPVSGLECGSDFIRSTHGSVYFYTQSRLVSEDDEPGSCEEPAGARHGDIYRYDLAGGELDCVTCAVASSDADVIFAGNSYVPQLHIAIAEDDSRIYFNSAHRLLPGAAVGSEGGTYRLDTESGKLAYVGSWGSISFLATGLITPDGSVAVFSSEDPSLNAVGGQQNGGTRQYYRYDDRDRSLICVSCPTDGSAPRGEVPSNIGGGSPGANRVPLSVNGGDFAFVTPTPLAAADQNTAKAGQEAGAGTDVYEWREGRLLLVSDGLSDWPFGQEPTALGITPSGRDIFFMEAAELTPDALDGYMRLYDARIGGGFEFPPPPKPCPLEVCQGTPKGAPEEQAPGTEFLQGAGNTVPSEGRCPKAKVRRRGRCVGRHTKQPARKHHKRAKHDRRATR